MEEIPYSGFVIGSRTMSKACDITIIMRVARLLDELSVKLLPLSLGAV